MCLPSKDLFGLPVRTILFLLMAASIVYLWFKHQIKFEKIYWLVLFVLFCTGIWFVIGFMNGFRGEAVQQFTTILFLISTVMIVYFLVANRLVNQEMARRTLYIVMFVMILGKIIVELFVVGHLLSLQSFRFLYGSLLGANNITLSVPGLNLFRINSANDSLVLALLSFYLIDKRVGFYSKLFAALAGTYFVLIVYSRVFFAQYAGLMFIVLAVAFFKSRSKKKILLIASSVLIMLAIFQTFNSGGVGSSTGGHSSVASAFNNRFNSAGTKISDNTRTEQSAYLLRDIKKNPIFGMGIGAYDKQLIRSQTNKYSYEKEYYALLMQLGIVGFILIIIGTVLVFVKLISIRKVSDRMVQVMILFNLAIWLIKPLYNPGLMSSTSASIIASIIIVSFCYQGAGKIGEYS